MNDLPPFPVLLRFLCRVLAVLALVLSAQATFAQSANYNITPLGPILSDEVNFFYNDDCPGPLTQLKYTFGDGHSQTITDPSMGCNTTHMYSNLGVYHTKLTVFPSGQSLAKDVGILGVSQSQAQLSADFTWSGGTTMTFHDTTSPPNSVGWWSWQLDGSPSYVQNPTVTLPVGTHSITLQVQNQNSFSSVTKMVTVSPLPPVADFSFSPGAPETGQPVAFTDASLYAPTAWSWNFDDPLSGSSNTSSAENPTHVFAADGNHSVSLTVSNADGSSSKTKTVPVAIGGPGTEPVADFTFSPSAPLPGSLVAFTDASTNATGWSWDFGDPASGADNTSHLQNPTHVYASVGSYTATLVASNAAGASAPASHAIAVSNCQPDAHSLCLNQNRFRVQVAWSVPSPTNAGVGNAVGLTDDTGYFWFFNDSNLELVIKVLDARSINHAFWVFYGALSNVQYTITVTDTQTGLFRVYENPFGHQASFADTSAFLIPAGAPAGATSRAARSILSDEGLGEPPLPRVAATTPEQIAAPCTPDGLGLCLNASRFRVTVDWSAPAQNLSGHGTASPLTDDTGYFWFFESTNVELMLKVLDGRAINGHFWVFYGALSDVQYRITVTDTSTGVVRTYDNPTGTLASVADTSAF